MADEIKLKAPTVEQQVVINISGEEKLRSFANTLDEISNNKNLQKYWKTQKELIKSTTEAYNNFSKKASQDNAKELIKTANALKAVSDTELSNILPDFDKISKGLSEAKKIAGDIDSAFSVKGFKQAFDSFEALRAYGTDIEKLFSHFGVSSDVGELQKNVRLLENEVGKLTRRLTSAKEENIELRNEFENFKTGSGFADKLDELDSLREQMIDLRSEAEETFHQFLRANNIPIDGYDEYGDYESNRFKSYFKNIQNGYYSASDAIREFKRNYSYLLEDSFKSNNDTFGLEQLQLFSDKLDKIFRQVEDTSNKISDIISNGVIAKSVENLSTDPSLTDSQRSLFGNLLQDEESLKSITALFQKLIDESGKASNVNLFDEKQLEKVLSVLDSIDKSLLSLKSAISDVGDGEEFSPLLKMINDVKTAVSKLSPDIKGIGLNMNIDVGSSTELESKAQQKIANALQAYERLFEHIKMSSAGGSIINNKLFEFDINKYDTMMAKLQAYKKFIENMRAEAKAEFNGEDVLYQDTQKKYWNQASAAMGQVTKAFNEIKASSDTSSLENMFGKTDLSGVLEQLGLIADKLGEIFDTITGFKSVFDQGFNVTASLEEVDKLTNRVKELEEELAKIKLNPVGDKTILSDILPSDKDFKNIITNLDLTKSELGEIVKITKQSVSDSEGKFHESYTLKDKRGSTETYGVSSSTERGQLLRSNIIQYDTKEAEQEAKALLEIERQLAKEAEQQAAIQRKKWQAFQKEQVDYEKSVNEVNNAISKTNELIDKLPLHKDLDAEFMSMLDSVDLLNSKLNTGEISLSDYQKEVKSLTSSYSEMVSIQQNRDIEEYNQTAKEDAKESKRLVEENIRLNKTYYDSKKKDEEEYNKLREKYLAEGKAQEEQYYSELQKRADEEVAYYKKREEEYNKLREKYKIEGEAQQQSVINTDWEEAIKINNALDKTRKTLSSLPKMTSLNTEFTTLDDKVSKLNEDLISGKITVSDYQKEIKSLTSVYSGMVSIQQKRDVEEYNQKAKEEKENQKKINDEYKERYSIIKNYSDEQDKLNTLLIQQEKNGSSNELTKKIELQKKKTEELRLSAEEAYRAISDMSDAGSISVGRRNGARDFLSNIKNGKTSSFEILEAVKKDATLKQTSKVDKEKYLNDLPWLHDQVTKSLKGLNTEFGKFNEISSNADGSATITFINELADSTYQTTLKVKDLLQVLIDLESKDFDPKNAGTYKIKALDRKEVEKAYDTLAETEEDFRKLSIKKTAGTLTDDQAEKLNKIISDRKEAKKAIEGKVAATEKEIKAQKKYNEVQERTNSKIQGFVNNERDIQSLMNASTQMIQGIASDVSKQNIDGFDKIIDHYQDRINELNNDLMSSELSTKVVDKYKKDIGEIERILKNTVVGNVGFDEAESEMRRYFESLKVNSLNIEKFDHDNRTLTATYVDQNKMLHKVTLGYDGLTNSIVATKHVTEQAKSAFSSFLDGLKGRLKALGQYLLSFASFYDIINKLRYGFEVVKDLDTAFTEMRKVSDESTRSLKNFQVASFDVAKQVGVTAKAIQESTASWMRLGESLDEAAESAKVANILLNVSEFESIDDATTSLVAMSQAYKELDKIDIVDKLNIIGNNFSVATDDLATGLQNVAAVLKTQGNDLNEAIALVTAGELLIA